MHKSYEHAHYLTEIPQKRTKLGLKGSTNPRQLLDRITQRDIDIFEFHLNEDDLFGEKREELEYWMQYSRNKGIQVYLHHPPYINGVTLDVMASDSIMASFFELSTRILVDLCEKYDCYTVVHWNYSAFTEKEHEEARLKNQHHKAKLDALIKRTLDVNEQIGKGRILWENSIAILGTYLNDFLWADMLAQTDIKLTFDISHAFISLKADNDALLKTIDKLQHNIQYFHVVDSMGETHDSLPLGEGLVDFKQLKPYIIKHNYIYEVGLGDFNHCKEMLKSHRVFQSI